MKTELITAILLSALATTGAGCSKDKGKASNQKPTTAPAGSAAAVPPSGSPDKVANKPTAEPTLLAEGATAPDFTAEAHDGKTIALAALRGKPVVLYFYPKDETPGCTIEAHEFRDELPTLDGAGATVIGVSMDNLDSHREFAKNHQLNFPLLADADGALAAKYGVSTTGGYAQRVTFVIAPDGKIAKVFPQVSVKGHAEEVLAVVQTFAAKGQ